MNTIPGKMPIVAQNIAQFGQHVFAVFGDHDEPGFAYTIGNANRQLPELLLIGNFTYKTVLSVLNELGERMREQNCPLEGDIGLGGKFPVRIRPTTEHVRAFWTLQVGQYLGHERYDVLQVLFCDPQGRYPGEPGCDPDYNVPFA